MAKRKFVEDSDGDDGEAESPIPQGSFRTELSQIDSVNLQSSHTFTAALTNPRSIDASTASTEALNREIASAYNRLLQPTPEKIESTVLHRYASPLSYTTPNDSRSKIKRTLSNVESPSPRIRYGRQTNGMTKERDLFDFHGSSDGEVETKSKARNLRGRLEWSKGIDSRSGHDDGKVDSILVEFASRNQSELSTSATFSKPDLESIEDSLLDVMSDRPKLQKVKRTFHSQCSEGKLPTPAISPKHRSGNLESSGFEDTSKDDMKSFIVPQSTVPASHAQEEPSSSTSFISPSKTIVVKINSPKQAQLQYDEMEDELSHSASIRPIGITKPVVLLPQALIQSGNDLNGGGAPSESEDEIQTSRIRTTKAVLESTVDELGLDDVPIGMVQEKYLRKQTRSRSGRGNEDLVVPADFSKKPETVAKVAVTRKRKLKRSKTTAFQELRRVSSDEEIDEDSSTHRRLAAEKATRDERGGPHSPLLDIGPGVAEQEVSLGDDLEVEQKAEVQKPGKKRGRPKKVKATEEHKSSLKAADDDQDRGLARAKRSDESNSADTRYIQKPSESDIILEDQGNDDDEGDSKDENSRKTSATADDKILAQINGNSTLAPHLEDLEKPDSSLRETTRAPETPRKPEKAPGKRSDQHSPINSGTVAYRVGLSKRARIEPLLRIVRK